MAPGVHRRVRAEGLRQRDREPADPYRPEGFAAELLARVEDRDQAEYLAEPDGYCTVCGANASWFLGYEGPQHFTGPHKLVTGSERRELFTPEDGHTPAVAWRQQDETPGGAS